MSHDIMSEMVLLFYLKIFFENNERKIPVPQFISFANYFWQKNVKNNIILLIFMIFFFWKILKVFVNLTRSNAGKLIFQWTVERESDVCGGIN